MAIADKINALAGTNAGSSIEDALDNLIKTGGVPSGGGSGSGSVAMPKLTLDANSTVDEDNNQVIQVTNANYTPEQFYNLLQTNTTPVLIEMNALTDGHLRSVVTSIGMPLLQNVVLLEGGAEIIELQILSLVGHGGFILFSAEYQPIDDDSVEFAWSNWTAEFHNM
jgi:hypothetical protein